MQITPDWEGFLRCLRREGTPRRVHFIELLIDEEIKSAVAERCPNTIRRPESVQSELPSTSFLLRKVEIVGAMATLAWP